jgi:hypothetical protein
MGKKAPSQFNANENKFDIYLDIFLRITSNLSIELLCIIF